MVNQNSLALGKGLGSVQQVEEPKSDAERIALLEDQLASMLKAFCGVRSYMKAQKSNDVAQPVVETNKKGLPIGGCFFGTSRGQEYMLTVVGDNKYLVGTGTYNSLSSAAEAVSGVRRSGWAFWQTFDGLTLKEIYGK